MSDLVGGFLRMSPLFKCKSRLYHLWLRPLRPGDSRVALLPDRSRVVVKVTIPYERMVWLQSEEWSELQWLQ